MRDAVNPSTQRAAAVEMRETAPQLDVHILEQVATSLGIGFIGTREPLERGTVGIGHLPVQIVLVHITLVHPFA
jgi:hypothetical protein